MNAQVQNIPTAQITAGNNDRKNFDAAGLQELADSIAANGLAQPITIRPLGPDELGHPTYQIVAGERRFRAVSQVLNWPTIPALVRILSDEEASSIMLVENTGRADLDPIEEANAYLSRIKSFGWSEEKVAKVAGVSADLVGRRLTLLELVPEIQHLVGSGHLPLGHAEALSVLDSNRQRIALRIYRESKNGLPLVLFRPIISQLLEEQSQDSLFSLENFWIDQVQQETLPTRGKRAVTGAPTRKDLPPVPTTNKCDDTAGKVLDRWISQLLAAGYKAEAAAVGNLYDALVQGNYTTVPRGAVLLSDKSDD